MPSVFSNGQTEIKVTPPVTGRAQNRSWVFWLKEIRATVFGYFVIIKK